MSTKRQPSKQRRQTQNQRQRAALDARRTNAAAAPTPAGKVGGAEGGTASASSAGGGSVLSRLRGAATTGRAARGRAAGGLPVGHRAAMAALLAAVAAAVVGALFIKIPVDRAGEPIGTPGALVAEWSLSALDQVQELPDATAAEVADAVTEWSPGGKEPYGQAFWPISLGVLLPVVGAALGFRAVSKRSPAKVVNRTMYVTLFGTLLAAQLLIVFLPAVVGLAIAAFQVRKHEIATAQATAPEDEVVEVDEVLDVAAEDATEDQT